MRAGKLLAIALMIAGCGGGGSGTGAGGRGAAGGGADGKGGAGQGGRTALHRGESDGTGGVTTAAGGTTTPSQGGRAGSTSVVAGQGGVGGGAALGGRTGTTQGQGGQPGGGVPTGGSSAGTGGAGQAGAGGSVIGGTGGGSGGQPAITGTGGQPAAIGGGAGGAAGAVATAGVGGRAAGGAGGAPSVVAACNAATCPTGCCDGNRCVSAPSTQQCGLAGAACQTCAACQRCSTSGACELDPQSRWQMFAVSATLAPLYSDGSAWDGTRDLYGGALPDPFVQFEMPVGNALGYTDTIVDSVAPIWNQAVIPSSAAVRASDLLPGGTAWSLWVGDDDGNTYAELMCEMTGPLSTADFAAGAFGRSGLDGCLTVSMRLVCAM